MRKITKKHFNTNVKGLLNLVSFLREGIAEVPFYFSSAFYHEVQFFLKDFNVKSTQKLRCV